MRGFAFAVVGVIALGATSIARADVPAFELATLEDQDGRAAIDGVAQASGWTPRVDHELALGRSTSAFWLRVTLAEPAPDDWILHLETSQIDTIDAHLPAAGGGWRVVRTGDERPAATRELAHHQFAFRIPPGARMIYVRVESAGNLAVPVRVVPADQFWREASTGNLGWGFYFAFLLAIAAYNAFLFAALRERAYAYYVAYLVAFTLFQASLSGHAALMLWPHATHWSSVAPPVFLALSLTAVLLFARDLIDVRSTAPRLHRPMGWLAAAFTAAVPALWLDFRHAVPVVSAAAVLATLGLVAPIAAAVRRGHPIASWFAIAYAAMVPGTLVAGLRYAGVLADSAVTRHALHVSTMAEALLLSFALAHRITLLTRERTAAQARALAAQDAERRRIAADLHDGLGQRMLALSNRLRRAARAEAPPGPMTALADDARALIGDIRHISHELHPDVVTRLGLTAALRSAACETLESAGVAVRCDADAATVDGAVPPSAEVHLYRIAQEAFANAARHAGARAVRVVAERRGRALVLEIEDDGRGLRADHVAGHGLSGMRERCQLIGATLALDAREGGGVCVRVEVPLAAGAGAGP